MQIKNEFVYLKNYEYNAPAYNAEFKKYDT